MLQGFRRGLLQGQQSGEIGVRFQGRPDERAGSDGQRDDGGLVQLVSGDVHGGIMQSAGWRNR